MTIIVATGPYCDASLRPSPLHPSPLHPSPLHPSLLQGSQYPIEALDNMHIYTSCWEWAHLRKILPCADGRENEKDFNQI